MYVCYEMNYIVEVAVGGGTPTSQNGVSDLDPENEVNVQMSRNFDWSYLMGRSQLSWLSVVVLYGGGLTMSKWCL